MKILKTILAILALLIALFLVYAAISPKVLEVKKEVVINAPKDKVFAFVRSLKNTSNQTVWQQKDPNVKKTYKGADGQVGSVYRWESEVKDLGVGEQEITNIVEGKSITSELRFEKPFEMKDKTTMFVESADGGTKLIWDYQSQKIPFPFNAFVALQGVQKQLSKDFEDSLANIKKAIE